MDFLVGIYNVSAIIGIAILLLFFALTIHSYNSTKNSKQKNQYVITMVVLALLILFLLYMLMYASNRTKRILGGLDVVSALT